MMHYKVAKPSEYLVITGYGVKDVKMKKKAWIMPGQKVTTFDITPYNYTFDVQAMSAEKLPFILPAVFTIGPRIDNRDCLEKYAKLVAPHDKNSNHVTELVKGVIEGETRVLAAGMTMEEIFKGTKEFKKEVFGKVQLELDQFGLVIYNANVKQLVDVVGHEYFSYLGQKTQQEAANQAKIDVAEARYKGDTGAKERTGLTLQNAAKVDAETRVYTKQQAAIAKQQEAKLDSVTKIYENEREAEVAQTNAALATQKAEWARQAKIAQIEATKQAEIREAELQKEVAIKHAMAQTEKMRAESLAKATVDYEASMQVANSKLYEKQKESDALLYQNQMQAEARRIAADAAFYSEQKEADAHLYIKLKEAEGIRAIAQAQGLYIKCMMDAFFGNTAAFHDYLMIDRHVYEEMAKINATALQGLNPKISLWNTEGGGAHNSGSGPSSSAMDQIASVYKMIPPLFTTIQDQTGITPPTWFANLPPKEME